MSKRICPARDKQIGAAVAMMMMVSASEMFARLVVGVGRLFVMRFMVGKIVMNGIQAESLIAAMLV